ncbi:FTR1 family protein [Vibrio sp. B1Z05]|uniref:FTR1 family protein n=1 Tax=Vibrio sp. B1Z05 TaxID=2654980 RepID=UPI00128CC412|nr:FTR1 family protein [Vibrio sp. B1Z05]MPW37377.1 iron permease [Vibrio sp. B1Z05]
MFASMAIVSKEGIDIALIITLLLLSTKSIIGAKKWLFSGCTIGIATAILLATFALSNIWLATIFQSKLTQALLLILSSGLIASTIITIQSKPYPTDNQANTSKSLQGYCTLVALLLIAISTILLNGFSVAFFLLNLVHQSDITHASIIIGSVLGIVQTIVIGAIAYAALLLIDANIVVDIFPILMSFLTAGIAAHAVAKLTSINVLPSIIPQVWNTTPYFDHHSNWLALIMHVILGYTEKPSLMQLIVYISTLLFLFSIRKVKLNTDANPHRSH